jgi:hypothetical protein
MGTSAGVGYAALKEILTKTGGDGEKIFDQTVHAIRISMEAGLRTVFIIAAIGMLLAFLPITTIPEISIEPPVKEKKSTQGTSF